jgi:hypothetical protein
VIKRVVGSFIGLSVLFCNAHGPRVSSAPYISGDSFRAIADCLFDETSRILDPYLVKKGDIIFVKTDYLQEFFTKIHPWIQAPYILITHNSDHGAPGIFAHYLEDEKIIMWFGQNPTVINHPKFTPIPIGIANQYWVHGNISTFSSLDTKKVSSVRSYLLGLNFRLGTNRSLRGPVSACFSVQSYCHEMSSSDHATYLKNMQNVCFILSPEGNGLDTHRTWEALLMGAIPIVTHSMLDPLFETLPVLIVNDWTQVTESFLTKKYEEMHKRSYTMEQIWFEYWKKRVYECKERLQEK